MNLPKILVLGATGFVGHIVYSYLKRYYHTAGTTRKKNKELFTFRTIQYNEDFSVIHEKLKEISLVINCIGSYQHVSKEELIATNVVLPHILEKLSIKYHFNLIHISTDAVFGSTQGKVTETTTPYPNSLYGMTKLLGETDTQSALTFRTSFLGIDPHNHKGLIETALHAKILKGYDNQLWSGCTTLQFAKLCQLLADPVEFRSFRNTSPFFHFTPLKSMTKYEIIKTILLVQNLSKKVNKVADEKITRELLTEYSQISTFQQTYEDALKQLFAYCNK